jgi:two-component system, response regulator
MKDIPLIEGNAQDAEIALECLKVNGPANRTHVVGDGPEALDFLLSRRAVAKWGEGQPILILLDLVVPILSGLEVLRINKADPRTRKIPVVVQNSLKIVRAPFWGNAPFGNSRSVRRFNLARRAEVPQEV